MVHAGVGHRVLKCNDFKTLFAIRPISPTSIAMLAAEATPWLLPLCYRMATAPDHAVTLRFKAGRALDAQESRKPLSISFKTGVHPTPTDAAEASSGRYSKPCWSRSSGPVQCTARWCWMLQIRPSDSCCHSTSTSLVGEEVPARAGLARW